MAVSFSHTDTAFTDTPQTIWDKSQGRALGYTIAVSGTAADLTLNGISPTPIRLKDGDRIDLYFQSGSCNSMVLVATPGGSGTFTLRPLVV